MFMSLWLTCPASAKDEIERLEYDATSLADRGQAKESMRKIEEAINLAVSLKRPAESIDRLRIKRTSLLLANHFYRPGYDEVRDILLRKNEILAEMRKDPEIGVEVDEVFNHMMYCGVEKQSPEALKMARSMCDSFPQFTKSNREEVHRALFNALSAAGRWKEAEDAAQQSIKDLGPKSQLRTARLYYSCRMQHKDKEASKYFEQLEALTGRTRTAEAGAIGMAEWLNDVADYKEALTFAERACAEVEKLKPSKDGSWGVSEAYATKAKAELGLGKLAQAEADIRKALTGSKGPVSGEYPGNSALLEKILRLEHKNEEAEKVRRNRNVIQFQP
ncbi:MAG: hypothetical protein JSS83_23425 [Cyanobacteria bacterium SZAS LIN-3]|nr:hypothetical protein [Cyanobacteria bacterium SZAS LIN-3]